MSERPSARKLPVDEVRAYCARRLAAGNAHLRSSYLANEFGVTGQLASHRIRTLEAQGVLDRVTDSSQNTVWRIRPEAFTAEVTDE